jgi:hypothetical protein
MQALEAPGTAVLEAFARIEKALWSLTQPTEGVDLRHPGRESASSLAQHAHNSGKLNDDQLKRVTTLQQIRNLIAHGTAVPSVEQAQVFVEITRHLLDEIS